MVSVVFVSYLMQKSPTVFAVVELKNQLRYWRSTLQGVGYGFFG
jgi:hypothetical protein